MPMQRLDGRGPQNLRPLSFQVGWIPSVPGSVLVDLGRTRVLCTAVIEEGVPPFLQGSDQGWLTAEYSMLPASTGERRGRERGKPDGRSVEIQRLIGRSLRAVVNRKALPGRTAWVDCDVICADGGTRTAAISGAWIALHDACTRLLQRSVVRAHPVTEGCAAVSVGIVDAMALLDLDYSEDVRAEVDMNIVMTGSGRFIEVQGTAEGLPFSRTELDDLLGLAEHGIASILDAQTAVLASPPVPRSL